MKFWLYRADDGRFRWTLVADDGRRIADATSSYRTIRACERAVASLKSLAPRAQVVEADEPTGAPATAFVLARGGDRRWRWALHDDNGDVVATSWTAYHKQTRARAAAELVHLEAVEAIQSVLNCPLYSVSPSPAFFGDVIALTVPVASPLTFGTQRGTVRLIGSGGRSQDVSVTTWGERSIGATLPFPAPFPGPYFVEVETANATDCRAPVALLAAPCPLFTTDPVAPHWGDEVTLTLLPASPTDFGEGGTVTLSGTGGRTSELERRAWGPRVVRVALPADPPFDGPYVLVLNAPRAPGCVYSIAIARTPCPLYTVSPTPGCWGDLLTLTALPTTGFGATRGAVRLVNLAGGSADLDVVEWRPELVAVRMPASAPFDGPYALSVDTSRTGDCVAPLTVCPPVELPLPVLPAILLLFENQDFSGRVLVCAPAGSPIRSDGATAQIRALLEPFAATLPAPFDAVVETITRGLTDAGLVKVATGDEANGVSDFWDHEYQPFPRVSAEDIMSSFILVGPPGTKVRLFNAPDYDDREGAMEVTVGSGCAVVCRSLMRSSTTDPTPGAEPAGSIRVLRAPDFWKGFVHVTTFRDELSSARFV
ncbi:MAG TPA: DUF1508 domain-containing protein [Actinomycetota bacterium]|nr:DUF1508 domain-containing protein [Actinomycetota bacterium]